MKKYEEVLNKLDKALDFLETEQENILTKAEEGVIITKKGIRTIKKQCCKKEVQK